MHRHRETKRAYITSVVRRGGRFCCHARRAAVDGGQRLPRSRERTVAAGGSRQHGRSGTDTRRLGGAPVRVLLMPAVLLSPAGGLYRGAALRRAVSPI